MCLGFYSGETENSAKIGDVESQYLLGTFYRDGDFIEQDLIVAEKWLRSASEQGHENAKKLLAKLTK